jgi:hypothetical protein
MWKLFEPVDSPHLGPLYGCLCAMDQPEVNHYELPATIDVAKATEVRISSKPLVSLAGCVGYSKHSH